MIDDINQRAGFFVRVWSKNSTEPEAGNFSLYSPDSSANSRPVKILSRTEKAQNNGLIIAEC